MLSPTEEKADYRALLQKRKKLLNKQDEDKQKSDKQKNEQRKEKERLHLSALV